MFATATNVWWLVVYATDFLLSALRVTAGWWRKDWDRIGMDGL